MGAAFAFERFEIASGVSRSKGWEESLLDVVTNIVWIGSNAGDGDGNGDRDVESSMRICSCATVGSVDAVLILRDVPERSVTLDILELISVVMLAFEAAVVLRIAAAGIVAAVTVEVGEVTVAVADGD